MVVYQVSIVDFLGIVKVPTSFVKFLTIVTS